MLAQQRRWGAHRAWRIRELDREAELRDATLHGMFEALQHGAVLLETSPHAPALLGIRQLTGRHLRADELRRAVEQEFMAHTNWRLEPGSWRRTETEEIARRVASHRTTRVRADLGTDPGVFYEGI